MAGTEEREQVLAKIQRAREDGLCPVVVVSAMGRKGAPYATDTLLNLVDGESALSRETDLLLACGEIISGVVLAASLRNKGVPAVFLTGPQAGLITDEAHGDARIIQVEPARIWQELKQGKTVVVAGFQGLSRNGEFTTLGRGGSDTSAAALGVALDAEAVEIYTDVEGVKTADPRLVGTARTLEHLTYNEVCQLAQEGARVIHPRAVEIAMQKNVPLWIKNTFSEGPGTLVGQGTFEEAVSIKGDRSVTGITHVAPLTQITSEVGGPDQVRVFRALADEGVSLDFITVLPDRIMFNVREDAVAKATAVVGDLGFQAQLRPKCAKVAAVGAGMTGRPGIMAQIMESLAEEGIAVLQSADSYTTIWCLVSEEEMPRAVEALHKRFCS